MLKLQEPYKTRPIRFLELWQEAGWRMKVYGIAYQGDRPRPQLVETAKQLARQRLPLAEAQSNHYGVGFIGVHEGRGANFVFVDWWADENELHHHVYTGPLDQPDKLEAWQPSDPIACVWDLRVLCFERQAWLDMVLKNRVGPDIEGYLAYRFNQDV
jgi:hypothetical protein